MANEFVIKYLANCYLTDATNKEISDALTRAVADELLYLQIELDNYSENYLDPLTAKPEFLDIIAVWNAWGNFWDNKWNDDVKRQLLTNSEFIWSNRGNKDVIEFLFKIFDLDAQLLPIGGWILNVTLLAAQLNNSPFSYQIQISKNYQENSNEYILIQKIIKHFLPCWIYLEIVYKL